MDRNQRLQREVSAIRALAFICFLVPLFVLSIVSLGHAQVDVVVPSGQTAYVNIGTALSWTGSGAGGFTNNFVLVPPNSDSSLCLYVQNNDGTNPHTAAVALWASGNTTTKTFTGNSAPWSLVNSSSVTIAAGSTQQFYLPTRSAARVVASLTGGGAGSTATVFGVWSQQSACGYPLQAGVGSGPLFPTVQCNLNTGISITSAAGYIAIAAPTAPFTKIFVCGIVASGSGAAAIGELSIGPGASGCSLPPINAIAFTYPATSSFTYTYGGNIGFIQNTINTPICASTTQTASDIFLFINYTYQ